MWKFYSRRCGEKYSVSQVNNYLRREIEDDEGDLVIGNLWSSAPYEVRVQYILIHKVPEELGTLFGVHDCEFVTAKYAKHYFTVLYKSRQSFILTVFTLVNGKLDCAVKYASITELAHNIVDTNASSRWWQFKSNLTGEEKMNNALETDSGMPLVIPKRIKAGK